MKYIKAYEKLNQPTLGHYVLVKTQPDSKNKWWVEKQIGKIVDIDTIYNSQHNDNYELGVEFVNPDRNDGKNIWWTNRDNIIKFSKNKEDLEIFVDINKYNL